LVPLSSLARELLEGLPQLGALDVLVHSHAGDDAIACLTYAREKLGILPQARSEKAVYVYRVERSTSARSCAARAQRLLSAGQT
jgi:hypothetical protein